jgi:hypothetical protein
VKSRDTTYSAIGVLAGVLAACSAGHATNENADNPPSQVDAAALDGRASSGGGSTSNSSGGGSTSNSSGGGASSGSPLGSSSSGDSPGDASSPETDEAGGQPPTVDSGAGTEKDASDDADASTAVGGGTDSGATSYPYIFSCFNDSATLSDLIIYTSSDALNWTLLYDTKYVGPTGFMRDPSIMRHTDGKYYVTFTTPSTLSCCGPETSFAIASSTNLKDWTTIAQVPCGVPGTVNTWSPEWFVDTDGSVHITATLDLAIYRYEPTDATLTKWGPPKAMGMTSTLDAQVLKIGSTYHMILPNKHGTAPSLDGPWTWHTELLPPTCKEAPAMVHIAGNTWRYYCDDGSKGHEKSSLTTDLFQTWSPLDTLPVVGNNISHGTVIRGDTGHPF